jgi:RecA-family ATPase
MDTLHDTAAPANILGGKLLDLGKFVAPPPPMEWAVEKMIPKGLTTLAYGTGGVGKSFWFLTLAMHMACGRDFGPIRNNGRKLRTCFFSREDPELVVHRRIYAVREYMGVNNDEWGLIQQNVLFWELSGARGVALDDNSSFPLAASSFCALEEVDMVVMDNLSMMLPVSTEEQKHSINAQETAAMVHSVCAQISKHAGCAVVLMHHPNKSDSISGSQLLSDNSRSVLSFRYPVIKATPAQRRNGEEDLVDYQEFVLCVEKNNLGPTDRVGTRWRKSENGVPFPSLFAP